MVSLLHEDYLQHLLYFPILYLLWWSATYLKNPVTNTAARRGEKAAEIYKCYTHVPDVGFQTLVSQLLGFWYVVNAWYIILNHPPSLSITTIPPSVILMSLQKGKERMSCISFSAYLTHSILSPYSSINITCLESNSPFLVSYKTCIFTRLNQMMSQFYKGQPKALLCDLWLWGTVTQPQLY